MKKIIALVLLTLVILSTYSIALAKADDIVSICAGYTRCPQCGTQHLGSKLDHTVKTLQTRTNRYGETEYRYKIDEYRKYTCPDCGFYDTVYTRTTYTSWVSE